MSEIRVERIHKIYKETRAVDDVSLTIKQGEFMILLGPSGCGKTTLLRSIAGLEEIDAGRVWIGDKDVTDLPPRHRKIAMVFQSYAVFPHMTVFENIAFGLRMQKMEKEKLNKRVQSAAELLHIENLLQRYPAQVSGGQRQRIAVARALMLDPKILVLDEPVSALDVSIQAQVLNLLADLQDELGLTYIFISHDLSVVRFVADQVMVMYLGRPVEMAPVEEIFANPRHPYTRALLSATPVADPSRRRAKIKLEGELPSPFDPPPGCAFHPRCLYARDVCSITSPELASINGADVACHGIAEGWIED